jgi:hypothetical protein
MIEKISLVWGIWDWIGSPAATGIFAALFALSESLAAIPGVKSNAVYQAVASLIAKLAKK